MYVIHFKYYVHVCSTCEYGACVSQTRHIYFLSTKKYKQNLSKREHLSSINFDVKTGSTGFKSGCWSVKKERLHNLSS